MIDPTKKGAFHSALKHAGDVTIKVTSGVLTSKYKKPGEVGHLYVNFEFDGVAHSYSAENEDCANTLGECNGKLVTIRAIGSKDEPGRIEILGSADAPNSPPAKAPTKQAPVATSSTDPVGDVKHLLKSAGRAAWECLEAANALKFKWEAEGNTMSDTLFQKTVGFYEIILDRSGLISRLPAEDAD